MHLSTWLLFCGVTLLVAFTPGPAVLLAGNGHVRHDLGVPQLIAAWQPAAKVLSVGFIEPGDEKDTQARRDALPYTHVWITAAVPRGDPCAVFPTPK